MKKGLVWVLGVLLLLGISGCGQTAQEEQTTQGEQTAQEEQTTQGDQTASEEQTTQGEQTAQEEFEHTAGPQPGDTVATLTIQNMGDIKIRLFPDQAPKAVENFVGLSEEGYYNGLTFHRVIQDFMIQGGDPTGTGSGGESYFGEEFEDEFSGDLFPLAGSLCMANAGADTNGSQFFLVTCADRVTEEQLSQVESQYQMYGVDLDYESMTDTAKANLEEYGGAYWLYRQHTVFGQIYEGMDVLSQAEAVETDANDKPVEDLVIETITISEYE